MPHTLRSLELTDEITAELTVLVGFDQDLAAEATRTSNRIRGLLRVRLAWHPLLARGSSGCAYGGFRSMGRHLSVRGGGP
jgi:hypothetical protein